MLPAAFTDIPIAHRGLHDRKNGIIENSRSACAAAVQRGYGIEIDIQQAADGTPIVFHDYDLDRLTDHSGKVKDHSAEALTAIPLSQSADHIPTLAEVLSDVNGQTPLLIEIKDQDGEMGPDIGDLHLRVAALLAGYPGPVALMSFNPHHVAALEEPAPHLPRGLVTDIFHAAVWPNLPEATRTHLATMPGADRHHFISHSRLGIDRPEVAALRASGTPILTWTIRSPKEEAFVRTFADNITFESYLPPLEAASNPAT